MLFFNLLISLFICLAESAISAIPVADDTELQKFSKDEKMSLNNSSVWFPFNIGLTDSESPKVILPKLPTPNSKLISLFDTKLIFSLAIKCTSPLFPLSFLLPLALKTNLSEFIVTISPSNTLGIEVLEAAGISWSSFLIGPEVINIEEPSVLIPCGCDT